MIIRSSTAPSPVGTKRRCQTGILSKKVSTHVSITPWTSLAQSQSTGADQFQIMHLDVPLSSWWGTKLLCWDHPPRFQLHYAPSSPVCQHVSSHRPVDSSLGDRTFPAAAARAWNSVPPSIRSAPSLTVFRRELKTVLFRSSLPVNWHARPHQRTCCRVV